MPYEYESASYIGSLPSTTQRTKGNNHQAKPLISDNLLRFAGLLRTYNTLSGKISNIYLLISMNKRSLQFRTEGKTPTRQVKQAREPNEAGPNHTTTHAPTHPCLAHPLPVSMTPMTVYVHLPQKSSIRVGNSPLIKARARNS